MMSQLLVLYEHAEIIGFVGMGLAAMSSFVRMAVLDREMLQEHKKKIKDKQEKIKQAQKNKDMKGMQEHQSELMSLMGAQMKQSFKPMIFTFIPFIIVFQWLRGNFADVGPVVKILGFELGWFGWYLLCSMIAGMALNKILKIT
ncbi:MAG TPA: DUF106 domain-containing protein [Candidatus Altiarchaeales archaeon]|nr:DUF106 domain-containing protein [Candidatus Altiarchaeales archaeon]